MASSSIPGGTQWYLPTVVDAAEDDPCCSIHLVVVKPTITAANTPATHSSLKLRRRRLEVTILWRTIIVDLPSMVFRGLGLCFLYLALWAALPEPLMDSGGVVGDLFFALIVSTLIGGSICEILRIPHLAGILWVGAIWANIPSYSYLTEGVTSDTRKIFTTLGLAIILVRAGLSISTWKLRGLVGNTICLSLLPLLLEATIHSLLAKALFSSLDYTWAILVGFTGAAVAPAVVVPGVLYLTGRGYGRERGPLSLLMSAVVFDAALSVWVITFLVGLAFNDVPDVGWAVALAPIQLFGGALVGALCGFIQGKVAVTAYTMTSGDQQVAELKQPVGSETNVAIIPEGKHGKNNDAFLPTPMMISAEPTVVNEGAGSGELKMKSVNPLEEKESKKKAAATAVVPSTPSTGEAVKEEEEEELTKQQLSPVYIDPQPFVEAHAYLAFQLCSLLFLMLSTIAIFVSSRYDVPGAGAMFVMGSCFTLSTMSGKPDPTLAAKENEIEHLSASSNCPKATIQQQGENLELPVHPALLYFHKELSLLTATIWNMIVMPLLFLSVGLTVDFGELFAPDFIWRSLVCFIVGMSGRALGAGISTIGLGFSKREVLGVCLSWLGKASVQGAVGSLAFQRAEDAISEGTKGTAAERALWLENATIAKNTAVVAILFFAPLGAVFLFVLGPKLFKKKSS